MQQAAANPIPNPNPNPNPIPTPNPTPNLNPKQSADQLPTLLQFSGTLPADTLSFRLAMLSEAAAQLDQSAAGLRRVKLPIQLLASTEDKVLPSVDECRKLQRLLPNARVTELQGSGHVPLLEVTVT